MRAPVSSISISVCTRKKTRVPVGGKKRKKTTPGKNIARFIIAFYKRDVLDSVRPSLLSVCSSSLSLSLPLPPSLLSFSLSFSFSCYFYKSPPSLFFAHTYTRMYTHATHTFHAHRYITENRGVLPTGSRQEQFASLPNMPPINYQRHRLYTNSGGRKHPPANLLTGSHVGTFTRRRKNPGAKSGIGPIC